MREVLLRQLDYSANNLTTMRTSLIKMISLYPSLKIKTSFGGKSFLSDRLFLLHPTLSLSPRPPVPQSPRSKIN